MNTRVILFMALLVGCSASADDSTAGLGECPDGAQTQAQSGQFVLFGTCAGCHSSQLSGDDRHGAPAGSDFDQPEVIGAMADLIYARAHAGTMPPPTSDVPRLSPAQVEALRVYLACGP
jgi:mono/diheme cytochrome c family protein